MIIHEQGWIAGYVTCTCGWAHRSIKNGDELDIEAGLRLFQLHQAIADVKQARLASSPFVESTALLKAIEALQAWGKLFEGTDYVISIANRRPMTNADQEVIDRVIDKSKDALSYWHMVLGGALITPGSTETVDILQASIRTKGPGICAICGGKAYSETATLCNSCLPF